MKATPTTSAHMTFSLSQNRAMTTLAESVVAPPSAVTSDCAAMPSAMKSPMAPAMTQSRPIHHTGIFM